jgi:membrane fusion protein (multidrug efflux system)
MPFWPFNAIAEAIGFLQTKAKFDCDVGETRVSSAAASSREGARTEASVREAASAGIVSLAPATAPKPVENSAPVAHAAWRRLAIPLFATVATLVLIGLATLQWDQWLAALATQTTNDAYVRAETTRLSSRVAGQIRTVAVSDFQHVLAGSLLVEIDPGDYEAQVAQAEAGVAGAQAAFDNLTNQIALQKATVEQAKAQRAAALAREVETRQEQERQQTLAKTYAGTQQKLEQAVSAYAKAQADVKTNLALIDAQNQQLEVLRGTKKQRAADIQAAEASLDAARLRLGYTRIVAPFDGIVSERQMQPGDYVNIGSNLISVVPLPNVYIVANYKETQLARVQPGQRVDITVDTFPGQTLRGRVVRVSPASGSQFALLPPDNATGNFTKVVQRIAVRIAIDKDQPLLQRLLPGMSVVTRIHVGESALPEPASSVSASDGGR